MDGSDNVCLISCITLKVYMIGNCFRFGLLACQYFFDFVFLHRDNINPVLNISVFFQTAKIILLSISEGAKKKNITVIMQYCLKNDAKVWIHV